MKKSAIGIINCKTCDFWIVKFVKSKESSKEVKLYFDDFKCNIFEFNRHIACGDIVEFCYHIKCIDGCDRYIVHSVKKLCSKTVTGKLCKEAICGETYGIVKSIDCVDENLIDMVGGLDVDLTDDPHCKPKPSPEPQTDPKPDCDKITEKYIIWNIRPSDILLNRQYGNCVTVEYLDMDPKDCSLDTVSLSESCVKYFIICAIKIETLADDYVKSCNDCVDEKKPCNEPPVDCDEPEDDCKCKNDYKDCPSKTGCCDNEPWYYIILKYINLFLMLQIGMFILKILYNWYYCQ